MWRIWPTIIVGSAIGISVIVLGDLALPIRPAMALWFLLVCPGMAFVQLLHVEDSISELTLAVALSLAIDSVLAIVMVCARLWSPKWGFAILVGITMVGVILQIVAACRRAHFGIEKRLHGQE
jgi:uncharacterized membrane protein